MHAGGERLRGQLHRQARAPGSLPRARRAGGRKGARAARFPRRARPAAARRRDPAAQGLCPAPRAHPQAARFHAAADDPAALAQAGGLQPGEQRSLRSRFRRLPALHLADPPLPRPARAPGDKGPAFKKRLFRRGLGSARARLLSVRRRAPRAARRAHRQALPPRGPDEGEAGAGRPRFPENRSGSGMKEPRIVFGFHAVLSRLRADPGSVIEIFLDETRKDARAKDLAAAAERGAVRLMRVPTKRLDGFYGGGRHQGVVARVEVQSLEKSLDEILEKVEKPMLLVLDGVTDPHNLGACLRVANAAGADAVIAPTDRAAGITPAVSKAASGAAEATPYLMVTTLALPLPGVKKRNISPIGADARAE